MADIRQFVFNAFQENSFLISDKDGFCALVDPGYTDAERGNIITFIESHKLKPVCILLTHGHFDHMYGLKDFAMRYDIPTYMDAKETYSFEHTNPYVCGLYGLAMPETPSEENGCRLVYVKQGDIIEAGSLRFEVIQTPGHSAGGLCFLERNEKILFSGDTLFAGAIGRTDHPGGDYDTLMNSIFTGLMELDGDISVLPGHGPSTDIATERMTNPFLMPFNEPYEE